MRTCLTNGCIILCLMFFLNLVCGRSRTHLITGDFSGRKEVSLGLQCRRSEFITVGRVVMGKMWRKVDNSSEFRISTHYPGSNPGTMSQGQYYDDSSESDTFSDDMDSGNTDRADDDPGNPYYDASRSGDRSRPDGRTGDTGSAPRHGRSDGESGQRSKTRRSLRETAGAVKPSKTEECSEDVDRQKYLKQCAGRRTCRLEIKWDEKVCLSVRRPRSFKVIIYYKCNKALYSFKMCSNYTTRLTATNTPMWLSTTPLLRRVNVQECQCYIDAPRGTWVLLGPVRIKDPSTTHDTCSQWLHVWQDKRKITYTCLTDSPEGSTVWYSRGKRLSWNIEANANINNRTLVIVSIYIKVLADGPTNPQVQLTCKVSSKSVSQPHLTQATLPTRPWPTRPWPTRPWPTQARSPWPIWTSGQVSTNYTTATLSAVQPTGDADHQTTGPSKAVPIAGAIAAILVVTAIAVAASLFLLHKRKQALRMAPPNQPAFDNKAYENNTDVQRGHPVTPNAPPLPSSGSIKKEAKQLPQAGPPAYLDILPEHEPITQTDNVYSELRYLGPTNAHSETIYETTHDTEAV